MAYGKIKADAFIYDDSGDTEITMATIASNSSKADTASPTFTGTVTMPATTALAGQASDITIIDNNAAALEVKEGSTAYVTFDTTDSSEQIEVAKKVELAGDLEFTGTRDIKIPDNNANALDISEAGNNYITFDTTDSSEQIEVSKKVQLANDLQFSVAKDILIPDNEAAGLEIKEGTNAYVTFDTTDSSEQIEVAKPVVASDNITLNASKELRLADSDSNNYIALKAGATGDLTANSTWTLPSDAPAAGEVLKVSSVSSNNPTLEWGEDVGGKILQIVQTVKTDTFSTNAQAGGSPAQITGLSANITPTTSGNKILVMYDVNVGQADTNWSVFLYLMKGGSTLAAATGDSDGSRERVTTGGRLHNASQMEQHSFTYLDTTSGTSQITYSIGMATEPTSTGYVNRPGSTANGVYVSRGASSITLFEIAQ